MKKNKKHYDKYKKFDVVYADFGRNPHGVQGGIRPGIVVSCDASNHGGAPQISVVPLSSKLKDNPVHVIVEPSEIRGYALSNRSDFMPEDIQTLNKGCVRFKSGYIPGESEIREAMDRAMIMQLNLLPVARKMVLEELEMKQNISAWKISSLNEYSVQIRLGSNLGGFFYFRKKEDAYGRKSGSDESR